MVFERRILAKKNDGRQTRSGGVYSTWMGDHLQTGAVVLILLSRQNVKIKV